MQTVCKCPNYALLFMGVQSALCPSLVALNRLAPSSRRGDCPHVFMLAKRYSTGNPAGWLVSEKYDGFRAMWDGSEFVSREGNIFPAPASIKSAMPPVALDGELYVGRGQLGKVAGAVRSADWAGLAFMAFDAPQHTGTASERVAWLSALSLPPFCNLVEHVRCESSAHLEAMFDLVLGTGGEGLMLRDPSARYEVGRSSALLKVKPIGVE